MPHTTPSRSFGPVTVHFGAKSGKYPDGNQVVVRGSDSMAVFDTPKVANRLGGLLDAADLVILSHVHEDHMAGLHRLQRAQVHVHEADLDAARSWAGLSRHYGYDAATLQALKVKIEAEFRYVPRPDAIGYADGATWELGGVRVRAVHLPGHTAGHSALLVEPHGIAFIGDIDLTGFGPYYGDASSSLQAFRQSIARLRELPAAVWITAHHKGVYTDRETFLEALAQYAARLDERERRLLAMLGDGPQTVDQLARRRLLYPVDYSELWVEYAERRTIEQHLQELVHSGRAARVDGPAEVRYSA